MAGVASDADLSLISIAQTLRTSRKRTIMSTTVTDMIDSENTPTPVAERRRDHRSPEQTDHLAPQALTRQTAQAFQSSRIKTVDTYTCREIMRIRAGIEPDAEPDEEAEYFWAELLKDCAEADAFEATWDHYRSERRPLWPNDILEWVRTAEHRREQRADTAWKRILTDRALSGWPPESLQVWNRVFGSEIRRGASLTDATEIADAEAAIMCSE